MPRNEIIHPRDNPVGDAIFVGLEHIEPNTGRRIGQLSIRLGDLTGRKARFGPGDIVYGYLRPYLNKVWLADFDGYCSVDQYVFGVRANADPAYVAWFLRSPQYLDRAPIDASPGQLPRIRTEEVLSVMLPLPPLDEQRRIAMRLTDRLAGAERARDAGSMLGQATDDLVATTLRRFAFDATEHWPSAELGGMVTTRPSPSTTADGEVPVRAVTSGCLTPLGFSADGLRPNRMSDVAATAGTVEPGEILVSRSNTADTVGRAALYLGVPHRVTATDLIFRLVPDRLKLVPPFLAWYLASLQMSGYWRPRSHGASSTMSKITKAQLMSTMVAVPPIDEQRRIVAELEARLEAIDRASVGVGAELEALQALPAALLRRAFGA